MLLGLLCLQVCLNGCAAVVVAPVVAAGAAGVYTIVNVAREQYPDINFGEPAPTEVAYKGGYNTVWKAVNATLKEMKETTAMMDKQSGVVRTDRKNLNEVSWYGKDLGQATFFYELNITVRPEKGDVVVATNVTFWEEKRFINSRGKDIPEGVNTMRHIFFRNLNNEMQSRLSEG